MNPRDVLKKEMIRPSTDLMYQEVKKQRTL